MDEPSANPAGAPASSPATSAVIAVVTGVFNRPVPMLNTSAGPRIPAI